jgi:TolB-like protein
MRYVSLLAVVLGVLVFATASGAQTTRPAEAKIVVLPFTALNPNQEQAWLGRSIQQSVLADLTAAAPGRVTSADVEVTDMSAAAEIGKHTGALYVVHGSFTTLPTSAGVQGLRIMGEVVESASARPVASFKATGLYSEIFRLEDQVASQIRQRMPGVLPSPVPPQNAPEVAQSEPAQSQPLPQVNEYYSTYSTPQTYVPSDAYYNYYYATPYYSPYYYGYGYGYPYGYFGLGWGTAFFFGSSHDHFHDHGGFNGGHPGGGGVHVSPHVNSGIYNAGGGAHMGGGGAHAGGGHR